MSKQINRLFTHFLRVSGFRGPASDQSFTLNPTIQPVAIFANEPEHPPRHIVGYFGASAAGANAIGLQLTATGCPIRIRTIHGSVTTALNQIVFVFSTANLIVAGAANLTIRSTTGQASLCTAESGQIALASLAGGYGLGAVNANVGSMGTAYQDSFILPEGRRVIVAASTAAAAHEAIGVSWEELRPDQPTT